MSGSGTPAAASKPQGEHKQGARGCVNSGHESASHGLLTLWPLKGRTLALLLAIRFKVSEE